MAPKDYKQVSEGVFESDSFVTSRPTIDSARVRQILNEQRPSTIVPDDNAGTDASLWNSVQPERESNDA